MPKTFNNSLRILLSRSERRALDRAARHRGIPTGRFARLAALYVAQECPQANLVRVHIRNGASPPPEPSHEVPGPTDHAYPVDAHRS